MSHPALFRTDKTSPKVIRSAVTLYIRFALSPRNVKDLPHERRIGITHQAVRVWWNGFETIVAAAIRWSRVQEIRIVA